MLQLDDAEYAIPAVDKLPSLESILAEPDCGSLSGTDDDVGAASLERLSTSETVSVGSLLSLNSPSRPKTRQPPPSGVILRHVILKGICAQIASASVSNHDTFRKEYPSMIVRCDFLSCFTVVNPMEPMKLQSCIFLKLGQDQCRPRQCSGSRRQHAHNRHQSRPGPGLRLRSDLEMVSPRYKTPRLGIGSLFQSRRHQNPSGFR